MLGVYAAVTRCDTEGEPPGGWYPVQKLTVEEAIRGFTVGAAWAVGEESEKGTIAPGKLADLVVWDADPFTIDPMELKDVRPLLVVVGGEVACERQ
jgi:predicted amidohydrolase YtcJ